MTSGSSSATGHMNDEGVLFDVLEELDRERQKRAEMEARVRVLEQEIHIQRRTAKKSFKTLHTIRDYTYVKAERDSLYEILDAVLNPGDKNENLTIERAFLELMPYHSKAQQYIKAEERIYEWQILSPDGSKWQKEPRFFPFWKHLPIIESSGSVVSDELFKIYSHFFKCATPPSRHCVLTNLEFTTFLNIEKGYPVPIEDGSMWSWVGPWRVETCDKTDRGGWQYADTNCKDTTNLSYRNAFQSQQKCSVKSVTIRRRKWIRPRTLVDYPYASKMTQEYLKLVAEKSVLSVANEKLSQELVETKTSITSSESFETTVKSVSKLQPNFDEEVTPSSVSISEDSNIDNILNQNSVRDHDGSTIIEQKDQQNEAQKQLFDSIFSSISSANKSNIYVPSNRVKSSNKKAVE